MKTFKTILLATALSGAMSFAHAGHWEHGRADRGRVTDVTPVFKTERVPQQVCDRVYRDGRYDDRRHSQAGAVIGGITGGIIGHQVGRGDGQIAATAVGAVLGAVVGDRIDNGGLQRVGYRGREQTRCHVEYRREQRLVGYRVSYRHHGHQHTRFMRERPGRWVELDRRDDWHQERRERRDDDRPY